jgi:hypothetical protein
MCHTLLPKHSEAGLPSAGLRFDAQPTHVSVLPVDKGGQPSSDGDFDDIDYSEEAIPERDPSYQLSDATLHQTQTVEYLTAAERFLLARCLERFGMSRARATVVANL